MMGLGKRKITKVFLASVLGLSSVISIACAKELNFEGKTIEWIMPFKAGGGTDKWGRFYAPLLSDALPGKPTVVIKNMPGGGSTKGANFFAKRASKDGLTILGTSGSTQFPYLLDDKRVRYDYDKWKVILASPTGGVVYISSKLGINSIKDLNKLKSQELKFGSQGATSLDLIPLLAFDILGLDVKPIFGMKGRKSGRLAFLRGETNIDYQTSTSYIKNVLPAQKEGRAIPLFAWGTLDENGNLQRDPTFPNLPHFAEVYESLYGKKPDGKAFKAWKTFFTAGFSSQKMIFLPKGVSSDVIETYEKAAKKILENDDFKKLKTQNLGLYEQVVGKKADNLKQLGTKVSKDDKEWVKQWLSKKYNVRF